MNNAPTAGEQNHQPLDPFDQKLLPNTFEIPHEVVERIAAGERVQILGDGTLRVGNENFDTHGANNFTIGGREVVSYSTGGDPVIEQELRMSQALHIRNIAEGLHAAQVAAENPPPPPEKHAPGVHHNHPDKHEVTSQVGNDYLTVSFDLADHITKDHPAKVEQGVLKIDGMEVPLKEAKEFLFIHHIKDLMTGTSPEADRHNANAINSAIIDHQEQCSDPKAPPRYILQPKGNVNQR